MLQEFAEYLGQAALDGARLQKLDVPTNDPSKAMFWSPSAKQPIAVQLDPPPRQHKVSTLASFVDAFDRYAQGRMPSIWVNMQQVLCVMCDNEGAYRQHTLTLPVKPSPLFAVIQQLPINQKGLLGALRHSLKIATIDPDHLELAIANLTWETRDTTEGNFGTVKSTMGRSINSEVKGTRDIPNEVEISFDPFPGIGEELGNEMVTVNCSVTVDPSDQTIVVRPYPGEIEQAENAAVEMLRSYIAMTIGESSADAKVVFSGTP